MRRLRSTRCVALWLSLTLWACGSEPTSTAIFLTVDSELTSPDEIDRITVQGAGFDSDNPPAADLRTKSLPRSLALRHESGPYGPLVLTVSAYLGDALVVQRTVRTSFVPNLETYLSIELSRNCTDVFCADGLTCQQGACAEVPELSPSGQDRNDAGDLFPDAAATVDGGAENADAASDAEPAPNDAGSSPADASGAPVDATGGEAGDASAPSGYDSGLSDGSIAPQNDGGMTAVDGGTPPSPGAGLAPMCSIQTPPNGATLPVNTPLPVQGSCMDPETGPLSSGLIWSSSLDGTLASGGSASITLRSIGLHTLRLCAADPRDPSVHGCASVAVDAVVQVAPTARITAVTQGGSEGNFNSLQPISLAGSGTGRGITLRWTDSLQGDLGSGNTVALAQPVVGRHVVTLSATDAFGSVATATRSFLVH